MTKKHFDIAIIGCGINGLTAAHAFSSHGFSVLLIDRMPLEKILSTQFDGRTSAIAETSKLMLETLGIWDQLIPYAEPIKNIQTTDNKVGHEKSFSYLEFNTKEINKDSFGYIVENQYVKSVLYQALKNNPNICLKLPYGLNDFSIKPSSVDLTLENGDNFSASLLVAADGKNSFIRQQSSIEVFHRDYKQTALVLTVHHENPHQNIAYERFYASGPFAILPMTDSENGDHRSSIVWTEGTDKAHKILDLPLDRIENLLRQKFSQDHGLVTIASHLWSYPLSLTHAKNYIKNRLCLIGDAAHAIHPIAGQGLNLGFRDIAALVEILVQARRLGLDIGQLNTLSSYEKWRKLDNTLLVGTTDQLTLLFSNQNLFLSKMRNFGLNMVEKTSFLRKFFMLYAMGSKGQLPLLLEGKKI